MEHSPFCEADSRPVSQNIAHFYGNCMQSPVFRAYPGRDFTNFISLTSILVLSSNISQGRLNDLFPSGVPCKMYEFLIPHMRATFCDNLVLLGTIAVIIFDEEHKL
jgi:hypothetical protein